MIPDSSRVEPETPWDSYALGWISANGLSGHPELPTLSERSLGHPELPTLVSPTSEPSPTLPHVSREVATLPGWHSGYDNGLPLCVGAHCIVRPVGGSSPAGYPRVWSLRE